MNRYHVHFEDGKWITIRCTKLTRCTFGDRTTYVYAEARAIAKARNAARRKEVQG